MSADIKFNGLDCRDFFIKLNTGSYSEVFSSCSLEDNDTMKNFSTFILNNSPSIPTSYLSKIIYATKILYRENISVLNKIDQLCRQFLINAISDQPGKFNFNRSFQQAKEAIIQLRLFGPEFEKERLDLVKLIFPKEHGEKILENLGTLFEEIELSDESKLELFTLALPLVSNDADLSYLLHILEYSVSDPKFFTDSLKIAYEHVKNNPALFSLQAVTTNINSIEQTLKIFNVDPHFFIQLLLINKKKQIFLETINQLKNDHLDFFINAKPSFVYKNINVWNMDALDSAEKRFLAAEKCFNVNPQLFANYLLNVFTEDEIIAREDFFKPKIRECLAGLSDSDTRYLKKIELYLDRYKEGRAHEKDCQHWDCIGEFPPESGIWVFKLKWTYHASSQARAIKNLTGTTPSDNDLVFPAEEPNLTMLEPDSIFDNPLLIRLGFAFQKGPSGAFISFPDIETFTEKWEELRQTSDEYKNLPALPLAISDGIASTGEFIDLLARYFVVVSKNKEFVHDMFFHVINTLAAISRAPLNAQGENEFLEVMNFMRTIGQKTIDGIEQARGVYNSAHDVAALNIIYESLGVLYDIVTARFILDQRREFLAKWINGSFFEEVFGPSRLNLSQPSNYLTYLWSIDSVREDIIALGVPPETAKEDLIRVFPYQKLQVMLKKIYHP